MSLRTRTDRLLEAVGVERTATLNGDVRRSRDAVGPRLHLSSRDARCPRGGHFRCTRARARARARAPAPANEEDTEAGFMAYFGSRRGSAAPAEPAAAPAPPVKPEPEPEPRPTVTAIELTGSQTEAERTAAARERAEHS